MALVTVLGHTLLVWGLCILWGKSARPRWVLVERTSMTVVWLPPLALTSRAPVPPLANKAAAHPVSAHANAPSQSLPRWAFRRRKAWCQQRLT